MVQYKNRFFLLKFISMKGIGEFYAYGLAKRGLNVILIARSKDKLEGVAKNISKLYPSIKTKVIAADLSLPQTWIDLESQLTSFNISVLINNAGIVASPTDFANRTRQSLEAEINLDYTSVLTLSNFILKQMKTRDKGRILTVSSVNIGNF